jgi:ubiquitin C-terminal hydrolase
MKAFREFSNKGLTGLSNFGSTCFVNSIIQVLSHTYELSLFLNKGEYRSKLNANKGMDVVLLIEYDELRKLMYSENCVIKPSKFIDTVQKVAQKKENILFSELSQNDVTEFLLFIIDCFHNALSRNVNIAPRFRIDRRNKIAIKCFEMIKQTCENNYSEITDVFYGISLSQLKSLDGKTLYSTKPEQFSMISVAVTEFSGHRYETLQECLENHIKGEVLDGDNQWLNDATGEKLSVRKTISYWTLPPILVFDLKRYNSHMQKTQFLITFPINDWNLEDYVVGSNPSSYVYDLYAICNHHGIVHGGHYTTIAKNANNKWYEFNDTCVTEIENEADIVTARAYCLFYRKQHKA